MSPSTDVALANIRLMLAEKLEELGWSVSRTTLFDEEGVEGWLYVSPRGVEFWTIGESLDVPDEVVDHATREPPSPSP